MRFGVLGPLAVWTPEGDPVTVPEARVRTLLARLLVAPGRVVSVDRLVEDLWGDAPLPANPSGALQTVVSRLRRAIGTGLVVHRSPGYLLNVPHDAVDSGRFAELVGRARRTPDPRVSAALLAEVGGLVGTPGYMAPELIPGREADSTPVDPRADVYSLGVVLYECLTGRAPHVHSDIGALLWAQRHEDVPPVSSVRPELPAALDEVVATALAKRPADRYTSCTELADELSRAVSGRRHEPPRRTVNWRPFVAIAAALAVVAAVVVVVNAVDGGGPAAISLLRIPQPLSGNCESTDTRLLGAESALSCRVGDQQVRFDLFADKSTMDAAYADLVRESDIARDSGDCTDAARAEHRYPNVGNQVGRVFCDTDDAARLVWTDDRARTIAVAENRGADALVRAWTGWVGIPSFPTADEQSLIDLVELSGCERTRAGTLATFRDLEAAIDCDPASDGATAVSYYRFSNVDAMRRTYRQHADEVNAPAGADCVNGPQPPNFLGNRPFDLRTVGLGSMLCYLGVRGTPVLEWTIEPLKVMVRATGSNTPADLVTWFDRTFGLPLPKVVEAENATARPPFPQPEESVLLRHVPESTRENCMRPPEDQIEANVATESTAAVVCGPSPGASTIFYYQFPDKETMDKAHVVQSTVSGGDCLAGPPNFSAAAPYARGGDTGRLLCGTAHNTGPFLIWTSDRTNILTLAFEGHSEADLVSWWQNDAGPT